MKKELLSQKESEPEALENSHSICVAKNDNVCSGENTKGVAGHLSATEIRHMTYGSNPPPQQKCCLFGLKGKRDRTKMKEDCRTSVILQARKWVIELFGYKHVIFQEKGNMSQEQGHLLGLKKEKLLPPSQRGGLLTWWAQRTENPAKEDYSHALIQC